jgi:hypothetical protein
MLSLYFNCRITEQPLTPDKLNSGWFYPITFPKSINSERSSQYEVLVKTIESYAKIKFDVIVFNIEIDNIDDEKKNQIKQLIEKYSANKIILNFSRPSTIEEWIENVSEMQIHIKENTPVLVCMNHDHVFVDYTTIVFNRVLENVFNETENNYGKALYYSHAPEVISWAINGHGNINFTKQNNGIFKSELSENWLDCICVMTIETLQNIWHQAKFKGDYIGRFDWKDVSYCNLGITIYVFPREFFKHYDGYGHVTGIRLISEFNSNMVDEREYAKNDNINEQVNIYYQKWLDCFIIQIRDKFKSQKILKESEKSKFINAVEESLTLFKYAYLEADLDSGIISEKNIKLIENRFRSHVYYMGNSIYNSIIIDINLLNENEQGVIFFKLKKYMPQSIKKIVKKILSKLK